MCSLTQFCDRHHIYPPILTLVCAPVCMQEQLAGQLADIKRKHKAERVLRKSCEKWMRSELKSRVSFVSKHDGPNLKGLRA